VFQPLAKLLVLLAAVQLLGGHWMVLQTAAWVGMMVSYSERESVVVALEKTFDGAHPCVLCKVVKSGRYGEQREPVAKTILKLDAVLAPVVKLPTLHAVECEYAESPCTVAARTSAPPSPPPQMA
jgi:hypothetical protein